MSTQTQVNQSKERKMPLALYLSFPDGLVGLVEPPETLNIVLLKILFALFIASNVTISPKAFGHSCE